MVYLKIKILVYFGQKLKFQLVLFVDVFFLKFENYQQKLFFLNEIYLIEILSVVFIYDEVFLFVLRLREYYF